MAPSSDRAPRLNLSFPLTFQTGQERLHGHCLNLSESGLLAVFDQPLELWTSGELHLVYGTDTCVQPARVARAQEQEAGMAFVFTGEAQRKAIRALLRFASQTTLLVGPPPF